MLYSLLQNKPKLDDCLATYKIMLTSAILEIDDAGKQKVNEFTLPLKQI